MNAFRGGDMNSILAFGFTRNISSPMFGFSLVRNNNKKLIPPSTVICNSSLKDLPVRPHDRNALNYC